MNAWRRAWQRSGGPFGRGKVQGAGDRDGQRDQGGLVALADHVQGPVSAFGAHVLDVHAAGLTDPQPEQPQHRDQCGLIRGRGPCCGDQHAELHPVQAQDLGLLGNVGTSDVLGR